MSPAKTAEELRLGEDLRRERNWKRWGTYLSERQWGTVREDYSDTGDSWNYFPHDHARSRAYRWGEDGLLGWTDRQCRICFAVSMWNGKDPILKERLFGLSGPEGNHGEDVKECYFYLDSTPTHSYVKGLYKYPQAEFPYAQLQDESARRDRNVGEFELCDTGVFDRNRYFDVFVEYAKRSSNDILIRIRIENRGPAAASIDVIPTLWFRNTWSWGCAHEGCWPKPLIWEDKHDGTLNVHHLTLERFHFNASPSSNGVTPDWLFTENETNNVRIFGTPNESPYVKDAFHEYLIEGNRKGVNPGKRGTKAGAHYALQIPARGTVVLKLRLSAESEKSEDFFDSDFSQVFSQRIREANEFYDVKYPEGLDAEERNIMRQSDAGLLWTKQFYHYVVGDWLDGDPQGPPSSDIRKSGRNRDWPHLFNRDVISMPDKWEYPWYAAWDSAFHMIPMARLDPNFAKEQLILFLREWYMHPNGQLPAYEWALGDVNPPVHAWACWRVYRMTQNEGKGDRLFLARVFQKLLLNFTWWVNRKDVRGQHVFAGGFLGLDNIGIFDRSRPLPTGGHLEQADGTAWMAFYCASMLSMAMELADGNPAYGDIASKFFEHYIAIAEAMNTLGGSGLWDEQDGFYYDHLFVDGHSIPLRIRSLVGLIPLLTIDVLEDDVIGQLPGFHMRMNWFLENNRDIQQRMSYMKRDVPGEAKHGKRLLAVPSFDRLQSMLKYLLDEDEFLSPYGIRSLSRAHADKPFVFNADGTDHSVSYVPGESDSWMFGGNSNWRGPIWFPLNYLIIEALERYHLFCGDQFKVECPTGSGKMMNLLEVANELRSRLIKIFKADDRSGRPCHGTDIRYAKDPNWKDLVLFYEYFHGDDGRGCGANHQTGWTALVSKLLEDQANGDLNSPL